MEGPETEDFDAIPAMTLWNDARKKAKKVKPTSLIDNNSSSSTSETGYQYHSDSYKWRWHGVNVYILMK